MIVTQLFPLQIMPQRASSIFQVASQMNLLKHDDYQYFRDKWFKMEGCLISLVKEVALANDLGYG